MKKISDFNSATEKYPVVYAGSATRPEYVDMPTTLQQQEGVAPMDTLPAQWWNAMWKLATKDINAFRDYVGDSITEINNLLTEFGITLDDADTEQLYDFFHDTYVQNYLKGIFVQKSGDTIDGDLHIKGDLSVDGIGEEIISTELKVGANTITLRNGNPSSLGTKELAGVVTENYDGNNHNNIIAIDKNGVARTGDIDITTRLLYSNDGTNFYTDESLTTPAVIGVDEEVRDTGNQTTGGVEIYEGVTYSNDDTQALATRENNPVDGAFMKWDATLKMLVSASVNAQFDVAWPVGCVYTQYPGQKSPMDLWGDISTWEVLEYGGAFFRADGGNADYFEKALTVVSQNSTTITFGVAHGLAVGSIVYDAENNESRLVASVTNSTTVEVSSAFTNTVSELNVSQVSQNKYHRHSWSNKHTHSNTVGKGNLSVSGSVGYQSGSSGSYGGNDTGDYSTGTSRSWKSNWQGSISGSPSITNAEASISGNTDYNGDSTNQEARSENFTYKIWKRTA